MMTLLLLVLVPLVLLICTRDVPGLAIISASSAVSTIAGKRHLGKDK